jgi:uncharacterized protein DUF3597
MSVFGNIMSAIFSHGAKAQPAPTVETSPAGSGASSSSTGSATPSVSPQSQVDVEAILAQLASKNTEKLDWRKSIVDLMKLLNLDSSLPARKELAKELHYTGDTNDSAAMNVWLHKQVAIKLALSGGKVPEDLKK